MRHIFPRRSATLSLSFCSFVFFFNDTATTEIYTLSLHDALPIFQTIQALSFLNVLNAHTQDSIPIDVNRPVGGALAPLDRKSTRLNSSHSQISYAVFCLKKKKNNT